MKGDDHVCVVFDSYREIPTTKDCTHLRRGKQKCTNINIVDADTCTLDIAKLLKISFYPTREQEEQAIFFLNLLSPALLLMGLTLK